MKEIRSVKIVGVGNYFPKKVLTNDDLEKIVDTSDEWITTRTGIKERRIARDDEAVSDMAAKAAIIALREANLKPKDIELIIVATATPDMLFPSTACLVQAHLKTFNAVCLDISAACPGYIYGLSIARAYLTCGMYKNALLIGTEKLSCITDWTDRNTCVLFGDGAGACVLKPTTKNDGILSFYLGSDGREADLLMLPAGGSRMPATHESVNERMHYIKMKGSELFKVAVKKMSDAAIEALKKCGMTCKDVDLLVPHQANVRIIKAAAKRIGLSEDKICLNIERYGNMSSASTATALNEAIITGRIKRGDLVVLTAFGSGLVWGACAIRW